VNARARFGAGADARLKIFLRLKIAFVGQVVYREVEAEIVVAQPGRGVDVVVEEIDALLGVAWALVTWALALALRTS